MICSVEINEGIVYTIGRHALVFNCKFLLVTEHLMNNFVFGIKQIAQIEFLDIFKSKIIQACTIWDIYKLLEVNSEQFGHF